MDRLTLGGVILAFFVAQTLWAAVHVEEVGLGGYYAVEPSPTRIKVRVSNPRAEPQNLELKFSIRSAGVLARLLPRVDTFN